MLQFDDGGSISMDDVTTFKKMLSDYFCSEDLGSKFVIILARLKKKNPSTKIQKKDNTIIVVSNNGEILRVNKRYNGYVIKINGSKFDNISFDNTHMSNICKELEITDKGFEAKDEPECKKKTNVVKSLKNVSIFKKPEPSSNSSKNMNESVKEKRIDIENDITIRCVDCGKSFVFSKREAQFFNKKGFTIPKRCKACREKKKNIEKDYYEIGLKKNTSQQNLDTWGFIAEFNGPAEAEGFTSLK